MPVIVPSPPPPPPCGSMCPPPGADPSQNLTGDACAICDGTGILEDGSPCEVCAGA